MKSVGYSMYVHKTAVDTLPLEYHDMVAAAMNQIPEGLEYVVVRVNKKNRTVTFIESHDWDTANEPTVGDAYTVKENGSVHKTKECGKIYHHKWSFVKENYTGFDIKEAKNRSKLWKSILPNDKETTCRIGNRDYWYKLLENYNISK